MYHICKTIDTLLKAQYPSGTALKIETTANVVSAMVSKIVLLTIVETTFVVSTLSTVLIEYCAFEFKSVSFVFESTVLGAYCTEFS